MARSASESPLEILLAWITLPSLFADLRADSSWISLFVSFRQQCVRLNMAT